MTKIPSFSKEGLAFENAMSRPLVWNWVMEAPDVSERQKATAFRRLSITAGSSPRIFEHLLGPRHQRINGGGRWLSGWRIEREGVLVWVLSHRDRGTSFEIHREATDMQALAVVQHFVREIELLPDSITKLSVVDDAIASAVGAD